MTDFVFWTLLSYSLLLFPLPLLRFLRRRGLARGPDAYIDALVAALGRHVLPGRPDTLYFGGGTPSLLTPAQCARLIQAAAPKSGAEITLEANPETVTLASLQGYRAAGVNRLSIGVQSARDSQLRTLGRPHTAAQARQAFALARQAGFANISGDIMLALPHYTRAEFDETLELIRQGGACHISAYLLKIEPGSAFGHRPPAGLPDPDQAAGFYLYCGGAAAGPGRLPPIRDLQLCPPRF